jgi:hypothetical protein
MKNTASKGLRGLMALAAIFALSMMLAPTQFAHATKNVALAATPDRLDFELHNSTGYLIEQVYVSPNNKEDWEEDVLGEGVLENGKSIDITFDRQRQDYWDLKVVFKGGREAIWYKFDLAQITDITISFRNGKAYSTTKNGG